MTPLTKGLLALLVLLVGEFVWWFIWCYDPIHETTTETDP